MYLAVECIGSFNRLLGGKSTQIDLLHSEETISTLSIFYLVDSPKAALSHRDKYTVTLFEQWFSRRSMQRPFTGETTLCLVLVGCTTVIAVEWRRKCHTCSTLFKSLSFAIYIIYSADRYLDIRSNYQLYYVGNKNINVGATLAVALSGKT